MRQLKPVLLTFLLVLLAMIFNQPADADGIIVPDPPVCEFGPCPVPVPISQLAIRYHRVEVSIVDQVAVTRIDQVFRNDNDWTIEGTYIFPLPEGAAVNEFTLWIDGEPVKGEVLDKDEARRTYEEIVRSLQDPALLEYIDRGAVQASVFPIDPGGERRIELEYTQVLESDQGLIHYIYPLNTEKFSTMPLEEVSVSVRVESREAIRAIYSSSHQIAIDRRSDHAFRASYEESDVLPQNDFHLYYSVAQTEVGLNLMTYRDPRSQDPDGYFLLLAAPGIEVDEDETLPKDVIIVLDQSGSMEGVKFSQAKSALTYVLESLKPQDRFNVIAFSTGTRSYAGGLRPAEEASEAIRWVDSLSARGATDINLALLEAVALADRERPALLLFLTDGLPTEGVTESEEILNNLARTAPSSLRLFAFGVGYDVDTFLLDSLTQDHHGTTSYVTPGQAIDEAVSGFYTKVSTPVLTDLSLDFGDARPFDLYPEPLPDLFAGSQLVLVGRYRNPGGAEIRLRGTVEGDLKSFEYPDQFFRESGGPEFLPRLWATRKIAALLNEIRLHGPQEELVQQVVRLSIRFGIVTPYTSYLVTEPSALGREAEEAIASEAFGQMMATPAPITGQDAVGRAQAESEMSKAEAPMAIEGEAAEVVRIAGTHTYRLIEGVWIDTLFDPQTMQTLKVPFLSEDYFALTGASRVLASGLALGPRVIVVHNDVAYEIVGVDESGDVLEISPELEPLSIPEEVGQLISPVDPIAPSPVSPNSQLCGGIGLAFGAALFPLIRRRRAA